MRFQPAGVGIGVSTSSAFPVPVLASMMACCSSVKALATSRAISICAVRSSYPPRRFERIPPWRRSVVTVLCRLVMLPVEKRLTFGLSSSRVVEVSLSSSSAFDGDVGEGEEGAINRAPTSVSSFDDGNGVLGVGAMKRVPRLVSFSVGARFIAPLFPLSSLLSPSRVLEIEGGGGAVAMVGGPEKPINARRYSYAKVWVCEKRSAGSGV